MGDMVRQAWRWWIAQMLALLAGAGAAGPAPDGLVLDVSEGTAPARLLRRRAGRTEALGPVRLGPGGEAALRRAAGGGRLSAPLPLCLRVPADWMLQHDASLPLAAEAVLPEVLRHELGRLTPFTEADVLWDHATLGRDAAHGRLLVRLVLALRGPLDPVLAGLEAAGVRPERVEPAGPGAALRLRRRGRDPATVALLGACAVLATLAVAVPAVRQSLALGRVERQMAALRPAVDRSTALRRRLAHDAAGGDAVAAEAARVGSALGTLAELTTLLPDGTYLTSLSLKGGSLAVEGRSDRAASLIAALSASPRLHGVAFAAPVTHAESGGDAFSLRASLAPAPPAGPTDGAAGGG